MENTMLPSEIVTLRKMGRIPAIVEVKNRLRPLHPERMNLLHDAKLIVEGYMLALDMVKKEPCTYCNGRGHFLIYPPANIKHDNGRWVKND